MAMSPNDYAVQRQNSPLEISASEYYFNTMRPHLQDMLLKCKTDLELIRTIEKVVNASDSYCNNQDYAMVAESFTTLERGITDRNYFNGVMKRASEDEKQMVRDLIAKISDLRMIIQCETIVEKEKPKTKERLNYRSPSNGSPVGENEDFAIHNMKVLNQPNPKKRIPNIP